MTWKFQQHGERAAVIETLRASIQTDNPGDTAQAARACAFAIGELERSTREFATVHMGGSTTGGDHHVSITIDHPLTGWALKNTTRKSRTRRDAEGNRHPTETRQTLMSELAPHGARGMRRQGQARAIAFVLEELSTSTYLHASVSARGDEGSGVTVSVSTAE